MTVTYMTAEGPAEETIPEESDDEQELPPAFTHVCAFLSAHFLLLWLLGLMDYHFFATAE